MAGLSMDFGEARMPMSAPMNCKARAPGGDLRQVQQLMQVDDGLEDDVDCSWGSCSVQTSCSSWWMVQEELESQASEVGKH